MHSLASSRLAVVAAPFGLSARRVPRSVPLCLDMLPWACNLSRERGGDEG